MSEKNDSELSRRFKQNPLVFIGTFLVLIIVVIAFVLVPAIVPEYGGGNRDLTFGYYDKVPVSYAPGNYLAQTYEWWYNRLRQNNMNADSYTPELDAQVWRESFESAVVHTAVLQEMKKAGYAAPEKTVDRNVAQLSYFQDENGRFSQALYRQWDDNRRLALWRQIQEETAKNHFLADLEELLTPAAEAAFIGKMGAVQRSFDMAVFSVDAYPESEYAAYIEENPDLFRSAHLSMITINSNEKEARQILNSVKNGETTFEEAVSSYSEDSFKDSGGDMGRKMIHELRLYIPEEEREQVIALAKDEYSDLVKMGSAWSFFRANDSVQDADPSDPAIIEKIRSYVRIWEGGRMENWAIEQAESFRTRVNEIGFEGALAEQSLQKRSFGPVPLNYGSVDLFTALTSQSVSELYNAANNENFWKAAFSTPVASPSKPVVQGGNVLVLFATEETEIEEEAREAIVSTYDSHWENYVSTALRQHFMNSPKLKDNFVDVYQRSFRNQSE